MFYFKHQISNVILGNLFETRCSAFHSANLFSHIFIYSIQTMEEIHF